MPFNGNPAHRRGSYLAHNLGMARSLQDQLDDLDAAIARAERMQEYRLGSESFRRPDLKAMYARRDQLAARMASRFLKTFRPVKAVRR